MRGYRRVLRVLKWLFCPAAEMCSSFLFSYWWGIHIKGKTKRSQQTQTVHHPVRLHYFHFQHHLLQNWKRLDRDGGTNLLLLLHGNLKLKMDHWIQVGLALPCGFSCSPEFMNLVCISPSHSTTLLQRQKWACKTGEWGRLRVLF